MSLVRVPEYILLDTVKLILKFIKTDYDSVSDKTKSVLYKLVGDISVEKYSYFDQAVQIFIKNIEGPAEINVNLIYNMQQNDFPSIYISCPSESNGQNSIGNDEGYTEDIDNGDGTYTKVFTRRYSCNYQIVITSNNSNDVILIYHVLKAFLISLTAQLNFLGFQDLALGGNDIGQLGQLTPANNYFRGINLSFFYETKTIDLSKYPIINDLIFTGILVNE